ncbi:MAG: lysylphosphatidylglycerol synthase domain-containing protein [Pseudomonadota bacterium]
MGARLSLSLGAALVALALALWLCPGLFAQVPVWAVLGAGGLYLASHGVRALRLAMLAVPTLGVSARSSALLHLTTAPIAFLLPLKLGELARLHELWRTGTNLMVAVLLLLLERVFDAVILLALIAALALAGGGLASPVLVWVSGTIVLVAAIAFVLGPSAAGATQAYMVRHHRHPALKQLLPGLDLLRRATRIGAEQMRGQGAQILVLTALIWALEVAAALVLARSTLGEATALVLSRTTLDWAALMGWVEDPRVASLAAVSVLSLALIWPVAVWFYVPRRAAEPRRAAGAGVRPRQVVVLIDDRTQPSREIEAVIGQGSFARILRRRKRLGDELVAQLHPHVAEIRHITDASSARAQARRLREEGEGRFYLRLPTCIAPLAMGGLSRLAQKVAYATDPLLLCSIQGDEAPSLAGAAQTAELLEADDAERRQTLLLRLGAGAAVMTDHLGLTDLRQPRNLLRFLSGSTEARHFNDTTAEAGMFKKGSGDVAKMRAEFGFFEAAPAPMRRFLLPTFDYWEKGGRAGYAMEHLAVPDVALQFVHGAFTQAEFELLLDQFFAFLATRDVGETDKAAAKTAFETQIVAKLEARLKALAETPEGQNLDGILAAAGPMGGLEEMAARAAPILEAARARDTSPGRVFGHGDPCFSNILFDRRLGLMRLIDPKGAETREAGLMHPAYDLAKFSHSVQGGYDFINNDLFTCTLGADQKLTLKLDGDGPPPWAGEAFANRVAQEGWDMFVIRAIELSLFLSMLPLHRDHPRKLPGFVLVASHIIEELESQL